MARTIDGTTFNKLSDQGFYSGTNSRTLVISDNTGLDGYYYKLDISTSKCLPISTDSVKIEVLSGSICGEGLENIPNAFSPDGDGVNDIWEIDGAQNYPDNEVNIFNRWGSLIYTTNGYNNSEQVFDGHKNIGSGTQVVDGTYFYTINLGDGTPLLKGYLIIQR